MGFDFIYFVVENLAGRKDDKDMSKSEEEKAGTLRPDIYKKKKGCGISEGFVCKSKKDKRKGGKERKELGRPAGKWHLFYLMSVQERQ